jgi:deazaflavin-dependent oxidoreductase (nitroreductase family)
VLALADVPYCYVTTVGRVTGKPHRIEIWFAKDPGRDTLFILCEKADWVKNLAKQPDCTVEVGGQTFAARGRVLDAGAEDKLARERVYQKYRNDDDDALTEGGFAPRSRRGRSGTLSGFRATIDALTEGGFAPRSRRGRSGTLSGFRATIENWKLEALPVAFDLAGVVAGKA